MNAPANNCITRDNFDEDTQVIIYRDLLDRRTGTIVDLCQEDGPGHPAHVLDGLVIERCGGCAVPLECVSTGQWDWDHRHWGPPLCDACDEEGAHEWAQAVTR